MTRLLSAPGLFLSRAKDQGIAIRLPSDGLSGRKAAPRADCTFPVVMWNPNVQGGDDCRLAAQSKNQGVSTPGETSPPDAQRCNFDMNVQDTTKLVIIPNWETSPYGCADLAGNVWEWTCSLWGKYWQNPDFNYIYTPKDGRENLNSRDMRVTRGGAFWHANG